LKRAENRVLWLIEFEGATKSGGGGGETIADEGGRFAYN
jgi:hypothetical protein